MATEQYKVRNRWTGEVQFTAEIEVTEHMVPSMKLRLAVEWARSNRANLSGADLSGANLRDANLSGANLRYANLSGANLGNCPVKIENIHQRVYEAARAEGALDMGVWHSDSFCGTTHCRAGWVTHLAGEGGRALEFAFGTPVAAAMIYLASDPALKKVPDFYCSNKIALEDMKRLAEQEAAQAAQ